MPRWVSTLIPPDSIFRFEATLRKEGVRGMRITIPARIARGLKHLGWNGHEVLIRCGGQQWISRARRMGRNATVLAIPAWVKGLRIGDRVGVELENPSRAR